MTTDIAPEILPATGDTTPPLPASLLPTAGVIPGESRADYDALIARICGAVQPRDILEEIWVRDVAELVWETFRLRRLKTALMAASSRQGLTEVLRVPLEYVSKARVLTEQFFNGETEAVERVHALYAALALPQDVIMAGALSVRLDDIERIDRMTLACEARRSAAFREIEQHRASLAQALRKAIVDAESAESAETRL